MQNLTAIFCGARGEWGERAADLSGVSFMRAWARALGLLILVGWNVMASAQTVPLHFGTTNCVTDEFGDVLRGTGPGATLYGFPYVTGEVVQILAANNGIYPPNVDGTPDTNNPVLFEARVGQGVDPSLGPVGMFGGSMYRRPSGQIIARVFNRPSLAKSSFYTDSEVFVVPTTNYGVFLVTVARTDRPLDPADDDSDGLNNSWEKSLGSNPAQKDTDGDGVSDGNEFRAGTDATNVGSFLELTRLSPVGQGDLQVTWSSVPGRRYVVEFTAGDLGEGSVYAAVTEVHTATGVTATATVSNGLLSPAGHYRVCLVE